jgi:hypothetical protein
MTPRCPTCGEPVPAKAVNEAFPFCSGRCRLIDLGRWLDEEYRIAGPPADREPGEPPTQPSRRRGEG